MHTFYRKEFKELLDTLINKTNKNLSNCLKTIEPMFKILSIPLNCNTTAEQVEKVCALFSPAYHASKVTDYDAIFVK